jgi:hypothetical protein
MEYQTERRGWWEQHPAELADALSPARGGGAGVAGEQRLLGQSMREYGRKKRPGGMDPNDGHYDRALEQELKRLPPDDKFLHGDRTDSRLASGRTRHQLSGP